MLEISELYKLYEHQPLLKGISFSVGAGETVCLLGASGSGKSTLLRIVAGLETPEAGRLCWDGEDLAPVPAYRRGFGLVFQDYALFPHLNVFENVAFGLKMQNLPSGTIKLRVTNALEQVNLSGFEGRDVTDLSGGEQQRVALARALAPRPRLLMFDEPLGALDRNLRERLIDELRRILHTSRIPAIYVTHDQEEAFSLADRVLLLHEGQIVRDGTPAEVWREPGSAWAANFLETGNIFEGVLRPDGVVESPWGALRLPCRHPHKPGDRVSLLLRPAGARVLSAEKADGRKAEDEANSLVGRVADVVFRQDRFKVTLTNGLYFYLAEAPQPGAEIHLEIPPSAIQCLA